MFKFNGHTQPVSESVRHMVPCALSLDPRAETCRKESVLKPVQKTVCHIRYNVGQGTLQAELNGGCQWELKDLSQIVMRVYLCT